MNTSNAVSQALPLSIRLAPLLVSATTGLLGGLALMPAAQVNVVVGPILGVVYGLLFGLLFSNRAPGTGSGLM
jgi:hypothetical protein